MASASKPWLRVGPRCLWEAARTSLAEALWGAGHSLLQLTRGRRRIPTQPARRRHDSILWARGTIFSALHLSSSTPIHSPPAPSAPTAISRARALASGNKLARSNRTSRSSWVRERIAPALGSATAPSLPTNLCTTRRSAAQRQLPPPNLDSARSVALRDAACCSHTPRSRVVPSQLAHAASPALPQPASAARADSRLGRAACSLTHPPLLDR